MSTRKDQGLGAMMRGGMIAAVVALLGSAALAQDPVERAGYFEVRSASTELVGGVPGRCPDHRATDRRRSDHHRGRCRGDRELGGRQPEDHESMVEGDAPETGDQLVGRDGIALGMMNTGNPTNGPTATLGD